MFGRRKVEDLRTSRLDAIKRRPVVALREAPEAASPAVEAKAPERPPVAERPAPAPIRPPSETPDLSPATGEAAERGPAAARPLAGPAAPQRRARIAPESIPKELRELVMRRVGVQAAAALPRRDIASSVNEITTQFLSQRNLELQPLERRELVTVLVNELIALAEKRATKSAGSRPRPGPPADSPVRPGLGDAGAQAGEPGARSASRTKVEEAANQIQSVIMERIDVTAATKLPRGQIAQQISEIVGEILAEKKIQLNAVETRDLVTLLLNDMLGFGPLEPLLADEKITDIMVNGPKRVYVERAGKLELTDVQFRDDGHVMNVASRIVTGVGRRVDESSPLVDARLPDGSRVNIIIPPLAIDGPSISIRKFAKKGITLDVMARQENMSDQMATVLKIAARSRLNILISGGTGSGKTTLLNAMSQMIDPGERIVTIEDAAELQLQQPHVVRLETRPPNLEGHGEISMRDLVRNALRMRPDRIILGEVRGSEAVDMLQAMNTGHEGSLGTIHANRPREALTRLENMIGLAGINLPARAVRAQIAAAIDMIIQVSRMRDGKRRVTNIIEVVGMEGDVITTQDLFVFEFEGEGPDGMLRGTFKSTGLRPHFTPKAEYFGLDRALLEAM